MFWAVNSGIWCSKLRPMSQRATCWEVHSVTLRFCHWCCFENCPSSRIWTQTAGRETDEVRDKEASEMQNFPTFLHAAFKPCTKTLSSTERLLRSDEINNAFQTFPKWQMAFILNILKHISLWDMQRQIHHEWCVGMRHRQMAYTQRMQRYACKKKQKTNHKPLEASSLSLTSSSIMSRLWMWQHWKQNKTTGLLTEGKKNSVASILDQHFNTMSLKPSLLFSDSRIWEKLQRYP